LEAAQPDHVGDGIRGDGREELLVIEGLDDFEFDVGKGFLEGHDTGSGHGIGFGDPEAPFDELA
jgi:hypothetical protein